MNDESNMKSWLSSAVLEYSCKNNFASVIERVLKDKDFSSNLQANFMKEGVTLIERPKVKPVFLFVQVLRGLQTSVETFASNSPANYNLWNSDGLQKTLKLLDSTYKQCEFISNKKYFSLIFQLKFLDLMHALRSNVDSSSLMQKLNLHFPRWHSLQKASLAKQFSIDNPKVLDKVEEGFTQCRRLILKLATDGAYRTVYMSEQFSTDMKKMMVESVNHLKEIIKNLSSNAGLTVIDKTVADESLPAVSNDLGYQLLYDCLQSEVTAETLLQFLNEMEPAFEPPSGGFSSCLLPFDTLSECSEAPMDSEEDESGSECSEDSCDEKELTITDIVDL